MNLFGVLDISSSALHAQRTRAEVAAANLANAESTRTAEGGPYRRRQVMFEPQPLDSFASALSSFSGGQEGGVKVSEITVDQSPPVMRYDPGHPDADGQGYVAYPAVNPYEEMVEMMGASRSYQLNAAAIRATKLMIQQSLDLLKT
jgi:flagellar basal-body rod protein FlgC